MEGFAGEKGPADLTGRLSGQLAGNANWWSCLATKYERSQASRFGEYGGGDGVILFVGVSVGEYGFAGSGLAGDSGTAGLLTGNAIAGLELATPAPKLGGGCLGGGTILRCTFSCNSLTMMGLGRKNSPVRWILRVCLILEQMQRPKTNTVVSLVDRIPLIIPQLNHLSGKQAWVAMTNWNNICHR